MFLQSPDFVGRTPKQDSPSQSPATNNSFHNSELEYEEDLHREIVRKLGVAYDDKNFCKEKRKHGVTNSSIFPQSAVVMGMEQHDP